jgi:thiol:disulfide interchange protein DsbG
MLLSGVTKGKVTVIKTFKGPSGLTGILIKEKSNRLAIVYSTNDGKTLVAGTLFDENGINLTQQSANAFLKSEKDLPDPKSKKTQRQEDDSGAVRLSLSKMELVEQTAHYVSEGTGHTIIWIFFDPNCIWCHKLFFMIHQSPLPKTIEIRWVPVGFLKPGSTGKASAILKNGLTELTVDEMHFDSQNEEGGAHIIHSPRLRTMVQKNTRILKNLGEGGLETPTLVYRKKNSAYLFPGFPDREEWSNIIRDLSR